MTYRIVIDTNLTISAFIWGGPPLQVFDHAVSHRIPILISQPMIDELDRTLRKAKFDPHLKARGLTPERILSRLTSVTKTILPATIPDLIVRDPKDQMILAAAVGGQASHLISGDKDLTSIGKYQTLSILTVAEFLSLLNPPADPPKTE